MSIINGRIYKVINKAIIACRNSKIIIEEHFVQVDKTIKMPKDASKLVDDYKLSRYACYLIVQNSNPKKDSLIRKTYIEKHNK